MADGKIRVVLDTDQASKALDRLASQGEATAGRINEDLNRRSSGVGLGRAGAIGAAFGFGAAAAQRAASGTIGAWVSEGTVGMRAGLDELVGGPELRANKAAREQTKQAFGLIVGQTNDATQAGAYYDNVRQIEQERAKGENLIDQEIGGIAFGEKNVGDLVDRLGQFISDGFDGIISKIQSITNR